VTESSLPLPADQPSDDAGDGRKRTLVLAGIGAGVLALAGAGFLLLSGGGSANDSAALPPLHRAPARSTVGPTPTASATAEAQLQVFRGSVGRDPFEPPQRVALALAPKPAAAVVPIAGAPAPAAAPAPGAAPTAAALPAGAALPAALPPGTLPVVPVTGAGPNGTIVTVVPPSSTGAPSTVTVVPQTPQYLRLLAARKIASGWVVDVRTATGVTKNVKEGSKNVGGTLFVFVGEDGQAGKPTFVFTVGESQGGNLVPSTKTGAPKPGVTPKPDDSTLVLRRGQVDGGIFAS